MLVITYSSELKDWSLQSTTDTKQHKRDTLILEFYVSIVPEGKEHMQQENWEDICHGSQASIKLDNDYESITIDILHKAVGIGSFSHYTESNQHPTEVVPSHTHTPAACLTSEYVICKSKCYWHGRRRQTNNEIHLWAILFRC